MRLFRHLFGNKSEPVEGKPAEPAQPAKPVLTPQVWLSELFERHGLVSTRQGDDWVLPRGELPAIRGAWRPRETHGRLDIQVLVRDGVLIEESFGGMGAGDGGLADGFQNFTINTFHVLLSALWQHHDPAQVETEEWAVAGRRFNAFIGNVGRRSSSDFTPPIPTGMLTSLEAAIRNEALDRDLHWFRFYVANVKGEFTFEALKDNEPWPAGERALEACGWGTTDAFYSARLFLVLRETVDEALSSVADVAPC